MRPVIGGTIVALAFASALAANLPAQSRAAARVVHPPPTYTWRWLPPSTPPKVDPPYSLSWDAARLDLNGLPLNPDWSPRGSTAPDIVPSCLHSSGTRASTCDAVAGSDRATHPRLDVCRVAGSPFPGHVNWGPATLTGFVSWGNLANDGDDNLFFEPDNGAGLTAANHAINNDAARRYIELEFNSDETLARTATPAWSRLQDAIMRWATQPIDSSEIDALLNARHPGVPSRSVVTGLFGLDCEHGCPSEVHPVLALAIEIDDAPDDNTWILFARNWGNEGYCSRKIHFADTNHIAVTLPPRATGTPTLTSSEFAAASSSTPAPSVAIQTDRSIAVDFGLPQPAAAEFVELVLHFKWEGAPAALQAAPPEKRAAFTRLERNRSSERDIEHSVDVPIAPAVGGSAVPRNVLRGSAGVLSLRRTLASPPPIARRPLTSSASLQALQARRDAADRRALQALCRASGGRIAGMSATDSARLCGPGR